MTKILSVGGSIIAPDKPDSAFLSEFVTMCKKWLDSDKQNRLILVAGGGAPARVYQNGFKEVCEKTGTAFDANVGVFFSHPRYWASVAVTHVTSPGIELKVSRESIEY